ncbi:Signal transduction histidine kinase CheA [Burkholderia singularis]|uniref:Signal transduction histidine kinase CheA n=1 Tax=Burkholderia singularis TaxID=1503053 RepID=A0A238H2H5_9BURK|nr:Signal transduction histidine kinase CheA [Burkholderia singularis]
MSADGVCRSIQTSMSDAPQPDRKPDRTTPQSHRQHDADCNEHTACGGATSGRRTGRVT